MRLSSFPLTGGLNITTPIVAQRPGFAYVALNYELAPVSGYRRIKGYERFDGRQSPSDFEYGAPREAQRALIQRVPGSGPVRGVFVLKGFVYAFRDTLDGMAKALYRSSGLGWQLVSTPTLMPGGKGEYIIDNFSGSPNGLACYGVDGVNKAFQFDGSVYTEITTGSEPLAPTHVCEYKKHLFLSYPGGSLQNSATGDPLGYQALNGAGELALGDEIYGILEIQGGALGVFGKDRIQILQGTSAQNFILDAFSDSGIKEFTVQPIFSDAIFLDKQIQRMRSTQSFGDFQANSISEPVRFLVEKYVLRARFSMVSKSRNQYYLFGSGKDCLVATFNDGKLSGFTTLSFEDQFSCAFVGEDSSGAEAIFMGGDNGYVYQFSKGSSFDGKKIQAFLLLAPNHVGSYGIRKRFRRVVVEADIISASPIQVFAEFDYGAEPRSLVSIFDARFAGGLFNLSNFDEAAWSGDLKGYATADVPGHGRNIAVFLFNESDTETEFTLESMSIGFDIRGQVR